MRQITVQRGFTLLEIAVFMLMVGLILAGVLKGQEMITSAKVKRMAGQLDEVRAAYYGFQDRFQALPGDYADALAALDCGGSVCLKGNGDNRVRHGDMPVAGSQPHEDILVWTHLARSGLLKGGYQMADGESLPSDANTPKNPYSVYLHLAFDGAYGMSGSGAPRHNLKTGPQIPVEIMAELDRKMDDGKPYGGTMQFSAYTPGGGIAPAEGGTGACTTALDEGASWNSVGGNSNCGLALLLQS